MNGKLWTNFMAMPPLLKFVAAGGLVAHAWLGVRAALCAGGPDAASNRSLPEYNPGDAVRPVNPPWWKFVGGPNKVPPHYGPPGGGTQYKMGCALAALTHWTPEGQEEVHSVLK